MLFTGIRRVLKDEVRQDKEKLHNASLRPPLRQRLCCHPMLHVGKGTLHGRAVQRRGRNVVSDIGPALEVKAHNNIYWQTLHQHKRYKETYAQPKDSFEAELSPNKISKSAIGKLSYLRNKNVSLKHLDSKLHPTSDAEAPTLTTDAF